MTSSLTPKKRLRIWHGDHDENFKKLKARVHTCTLNYDRNAANIRKTQADHNTELYLLEKTFEDVAKNKEAVRQTKARLDKAKQEFDQAEKALAAVTANVQDKFESIRNHEIENVELIKKRGSLKSDLVESTDEVIRYGDAIASSCKVWAQEHLEMCEKETVLFGYSTSSRGWVTDLDETNIFADESVQTALMERINNKGVPQPTIATFFLLAMMGKPLPKTFENSHNFQDAMSRFVPKIILETPAQNNEEWIDFDKDPDKFFIEVLSPPKGPNYILHVGNMNFVSMQSGEVLKGSRRLKCLFRCDKKEFFASVIDEMIKDPVGDSMTFQIYKIRELES